MGDEKIIDAFKKYLPKRVFEKIISNPDCVRVEGERRFVTILFGDLSGFTSLTEKLEDPEKIVEVVNKYFKRMLEIVEKYEGDVDKFLGDAIMVVFGAPVSHKDDPERAIRAAIEMIEAVKELGKIKTKKGDVEINMSIGINTGEVVALNMGSDKRMEYTVMGDNVNLAARLESVAKAGEIIISDRTYKYVKDAFEFEKLNPVSVKGKEKPIQIYKVKGIKEGKREKFYEIFIDREEELEELRRFREYSFAKEGLKINVYGDFGIGKSTLINRFLQEKGFRVIKISGDKFRRNIPFSSFTNFITDYYGKNIPQNLLDFFEIKEEKEIFKKLKGKFYNYFFEISNVSPLIVFINDYDSVDRITLNSFEEMKISDKKIMIVLESENKIEGWNNIKIEGFNLEKTGELLSKYVNIPLEKKIIDFIYKKSKGNPFFTIQIFEILKSKRFIRKYKGEYRIAKGLSSFYLPESVSGIIIDFLDRLPEELYTLVQYSSVLGNRFDINMIKGIYNISFEKINSIIDSGIKSGVFKKFGEEIEFSSPLFQEAAYSTLFKKRKAELHKKAGYFLEEYLKERIGNYSDILGWHFENAGETEKAIIYYFDTEKRMRYLSEYNTAIQYIQKIEELNRKLRSKKYKIEATIEKGKIYFNTGDVKLSKECFENVLEDKDIDENRRGDISGYYAALLVRTGDVENALIYNKRAIKHYKNAKNRIGEAHTNINMGVIYLNTGRFKDAMECFKNSLDIALKENKLEISGTAYFNIAYINDLTGNIEEAKKNYNLSLDIWKRLKNKKWEEQIYANLGAMFVSTGNYDEGEIYLNQALSIADEIGDIEHRARAHLNLGIIESSRNNFEKALDYYNDAIEYFKSQGMLNEMNICLSNIAEIYEKRCEFDIAIDNYNAAIEGARKTGDRALESYILQKLGDIYFITGKVNLSIDSLNLCAKISKEIGINDFVIDASQTLSRIYLFFGRKDLCEENLFFDENIISNPEILGRFIEAKANLFIENKEYENAINLGNRLIKMGNDLKNQYLRILGLLVNIDAKSSMNIDTSQEIWDAEEILKRNDFPLIRLKLMKLSGRMFLYLGDFTSAFSTFEMGLNETKKKKVIFLELGFYNSLIEAFRFIKREFKIIELSIDAMKTILNLTDGIQEDLRNSFYFTKDVKGIIENGIKYLYEERNLPLAIEFLKGIPDNIREEFLKEIQETDFYKELRNHI